MVKTKKIRFGIFPKTLLTMVIVAITPLIAIWYVNYLNTSERITLAVDQQFTEGLGHLTHHVDSWVDMNRRMLQQNAKLPDIQSMQATRQNPILKLITGEYDWNYLAFTVAPDGQNIGRSDGKEPRFYGDRVYVKQVLEGKPMGKQVLIGKTSGKPAFVLAVPTQDESGGLGGVLAIAMTISQVSQRIISTRIGETGFAFLVDESGKVIAHPSDELTNKRQDLSADPAVAAALEGGQESLVFSNVRGEKVIAYMQRTQDGWLMVMQQDFDEAYRTLSESSRNAFVLLGVTLVIVILVAVLFSRRISVPILKLTEVADALSHGKMHVEVEGTDRRDEIGLLANAVVRLGASIRLAMERLNRRTKRAT